MAGERAIVDSARSGSGAFDRLRALIGAAGAIGGLGKRRASSEG